jgi:hypothetical protein
MGGECSDLYSIQILIIGIMVCKISPSANGANTEAQNANAGS